MRTTYGISVLALLLLATGASSLSLCKYSSSLIVFSGFENLLNIEDLIYVILLKNPFLC
jgi:hypothetical protein